MTNRRLGANDGENGSRSRDERLIIRIEPSYNMRESTGIVRDFPESSLLQRCTHALETAAGKFSTSPWAPPQ